MQTPEFGDKTIHRQGCNTWKPGVQQKWYFKLMGK